MLIIRRLNCIDAVSGIVTLSQWPSGRPLTEMHGLQIIKFAINCSIFKSSSEKIAVGQRRNSLAIMVPANSFHHHKRSSVFRVLSQINPVCTLATYSKKSI